MKKLIAAVLILLMLAPAAFADTEMTFRLNGAEGVKEGDTVTLVAQVENAPVCSSFRVFFTYDTEALEPVESAQLNVRGMFMANLNATVEGKPAVSVLSADASKVFEGNVDLFSLTFKVKKQPSADSPIQLAMTEFFDGDLNPVTPKTEVGKLVFGTADAPAAPNTPDTPAVPETPKEETPSLPEGDWTVEDDKIVVEDSQGNKNEYTPDEDFQEPENGQTVTTPVYDENKNQAGTVIVEKDESGNVTVTPMKPLPEGNWILGDDQALVMDAQGNSTIYDTEYQPPKKGETVEVPLYSQDGKPAGSLSVEQDKDGNITVTPNDPAGNKTEKPDQSIFPWLVWAAAAIAIGTALTVSVIMMRRKKKNVEE